MVKIAPSMLCADFARLGEVVAELEAAGADQFHFDIMDGHFVPNLSFGSLVLKALRGRTQLPFDAHLMVDHAESYLEEFVEAGTNIVIVHVESTPELPRILTRIRELGAKPGVALNPETPLCEVEPVLDAVDLALVMSVHPGYAGQVFMPSVIPKIERLALLKRQQSLLFEIAVDGGMNTETAPVVVQSGATLLVGGASSVFLEDRPLKQNFGEFRRAVVAATNTAR